MQILQWLFKGAHEQEREGTKREDVNDQNAKGKDIFLHDHHRRHRRTKRNEERKLGGKSLKIFAFVCRKDIPKACFYSTLNLKRIGSFVYSKKMKREETSIGVGITNKADSSASHVGKKVLPITEASFSNSQTKDETNRREKRKPVSRMKELFRWAANSKAEKARKFNGRKVVQCRRGGTIKGVQNDDEVNRESSKLSLRWDLIENNNTSQNTQSTAIEPITSAQGNWITTDNEFLVLEL